VTLPATREVLAENVRLLRTKASGYAIMGAVIAFCAIVVATLLVSVYETGSLSLQGIILAQRSNMALWALDLTPFAFALWGQMVSSALAYEAGALVVDQTSELRTQTAALELQAQHGATHDRLTELPNRVLLRDRLQQALSAARRETGRVAVLVLDLDGFKEINNTLGHHSGDVLLKHVAGRLRGAVREPDTVARLAGDRFALMLPRLRAASDAALVADKLNKSLEPSFSVDGLRVNVFASVGIAVYPEHGEDADTLLQRADVAIYAAKQTSGFSVSTYSQKLDRYSPRRLTLVGELRKGIEQQELLLHYQPKVALASGGLTGVEALVRWQHPEHGLLPPDAFIPLAEQTGLIRPLTHWVAAQALSQCAAWQRAGNDLRCAVNVSARVLLDPEFPDLVAGVLAASEVNQGALAVEITEGTLMADQERAQEALTRLRQLGVRISIDDFGTGYSSLGYLRRLPIDEIKIDKSFVVGMNENENDGVIVRATIALAHNLGLSVTAEGVCSESLWTQLVEYGCDEAQGEYISLPRPVETLGAWMAACPWTLPKQTSEAPAGRPAQQPVAENHALWKRS
jgi:diguanylate cyclase (GGDEF)-like protein